MKKIIVILIALVLVLGYFLDPYFTVPFQKGDSFVIAGKTINGAETRRISGDLSKLHLNLYDRIGDYFNRKKNDVEISPGATTTQCQIFQQLNMTPVTGSTIETIDLVHNGKVIMSYVLEEDCGWYMMYDKNKNRELFGDQTALQDLSLYAQK